MKDDPALAFALTLKRWFRSNDWPQKITDDWAKDPGVMHPHGPWASQMCGAMKASGYNPKAEFFLALGAFNRFVFEQELTRVKDEKLRGRLKDAKPLLLENGQPYGGPEFWSSYAGVLDPPEEYVNQSKEMTQEDVDEITRLHRASFREISLKHMCSKLEAWEMLKEKMLEIATTAGGNPHDKADCLDWVQEVLAGLREPTVEEAIRQAKLWDGVQPLQKAMEELLGTKKQMPTVSEKRPSAAKESLSPSSL